MVLNQLENNPEQTKTGDIADHFLQCSKLGRYLTIADNSRFMITDDFKVNSFIPEASAIAAIYSRDSLVAQAALFPLSGSVESMSAIQRDKYERLFLLIEEEALENDVKISARTLLQAQFRKAEIRALEVELGEKLSPARVRYRNFLKIVKKLMEKKLTSGPFLDEFRGFTQEVAGNLDFGIYSFCLDRLFGSLRVPMKVKKLLVLEIIRYPPIIRRELLTNILAFRGQLKELIEFSKYLINTELEKSVKIEMELLEAVKLQQLSIDEIEIGLKT